MGKGYQHYVSEVDLDESFPDEYNFILVNELEELERIFNENKDEDYIAWDLETSDLDPEVGEIVGLSFAFEKETGYYVPLDHARTVTQDCSNIEDKQEALEICCKNFKEKKKNFLFNMRFDYRFYEYAGFDMSDASWYDVSIPVWFADTNKKMPSLKWAARHFMGWDMMTFEETLGDNNNFKYVEPDIAAEYAGADAMATYGLAGATLKYFKEGETAAKIDNKLLYPLMKFEDHPLPINVKYLEGLLLDVQEKLKDLEKDIYAIAGYNFNINSGQQLSGVLEELGLHTGEYTKSGYMRTAKSLIAKLDHPISDKIIEYKELSKAQNSYIDTLARYGKEEEAGGEGKLRFAYYNTNVPTGRLACGGDKKNSYFAKVNLQSIPKADSKMWYVHEADEEHSDDENIINGYRFSKEEKSDQVAEGFDPYLNIRKAFEAENDEFYWVSIDFSSQELRIPTNLCISYETKVETNLGRIKLKEIKKALNDDVYVEIKTPVGYKQITNFYDNGSQEKCKVNLSNGKQIICSPNHKFLVSNGDEIYFKALKNINIKEEFLIEEDDDVSEEELRKTLQES